MIFKENCDKFSDMADIRKHSAGKGDKPRPVDIQKYVNNFDLIKWKKKDVDKKENSK